MALGASDNGRGYVARVDDAAILAERVLWLTGVCEGSAPPASVAAAAVVVSVLVRFDQVVIGSSSVPVLLRSAKVGRIVRYFVGGYCSDDVNACGPT